MTTLKSTIDPATGEWVEVPVILTRENGKWVEKPVPVPELRRAG